MAICLILKPGIGRAEFANVAADTGFTFSEEQIGDGDRTAYIQVWQWPNRERITTRVSYFEDPIVNMIYFLVEGWEVPSVAERLTARLPVWTEEELLDTALDAAKHNEQVRAINRIAIGFVEFDPAVFTIIMTFATQSQSPLIREAAVNSMAFRAWPQFGLLLKRIAAEDPAENVRQHAAAILSHWPHPEELTAG